MVRGSHSTRSMEFRLAQGTVTLFSNFTPQRGKGTKHNLVSLSLLCILNLIYETRFNLNCLFFFTIWNVFAFCFFRDWWWCCFLRVCVCWILCGWFSLCMFVLCVVVLLCGGEALTYWIYSFFSSMVQRNVWRILWRVWVSEVWMRVLEIQLTGSFFIPKPHLMHKSTLLLVGRQSKLRGGLSSMSIGK